jgi:hypothetical protein
MRKCVILSGPDMKRRDATSGDSMKVPGGDEAPKGRQDTCSGESRDDEFVVIISHVEEAHFFAF